jgi:secreted Zn-dependent insulinase-like peptidase
MLVKQGPQDFVFEESSKIGKIKFDFSEKVGPMAYAQTLAALMKQFTTPEDIPHMLRQRYISDEFDKARVQELSEIMADHKNTLIFLSTKKFEDKDLNKHEEWYNIDYASDPYSSELLKKIIEPCKDNGKKLGLPVPNTLLPTKFDILDESKSDSEQISLVKKWENAELWYKKDDKFKVPKAIVKMRLFTNDCSFTKIPQGRLFAQVWEKCLDEYLREFNYMADCAELNFSLSLMQDKIKFEWSGYNDSLIEYVKQTILQLTKFKLSNELRDIFGQVKEQMLMEYKNVYLQQTFRMAMQLCAHHLEAVEFEPKVLRELLVNY